MDNNREVRGASTPFRFKSPSDDDFIEIEDDQTSMLMIKTTTAYCKETLQQTREDEKRLKRQIQKFESVESELSGSMKTLQDELVSNKKMGYVETHMQPRKLCKFNSFIYPYIDIDFFFSDSTVHLNFALANNSVSCFKANIYL